jgi:hypothetical protein
MRGFVQGASHLWVIILVDSTDYRQCIYTVIITVRLHLGVLKLDVLYVLVVLYRRRDRPFSP